MRSLPIRRRIATLVLVLAAASVVAHSSPAQSPDDPLHTATRDELDVAKVLVAQEKAWNKGDIDAFVGAYKDSPQTLFIARQVSKGYAEILAEYKHDYPTRSSMGNLGYSELDVHSLSTTFAVCTGHYHLDRSHKEGGPADGLFSVILEKTSTGWKIVVDHTT